MWPPPGHPASGPAGIYGLRQLGTQGGSCLRRVPSPPLTSALSSRWQHSRWWGQELLLPAGLGLGQGHVQKHTHARIHTHTHVLGRPSFPGPVLLGDLVSTEHLCRLPLPGSRGRWHKAGLQVRGLGCVVRSEASTRKMGTIRLHALPAAGQGSLLGDWGRDLQDRAGCVLLALVARVAVPSYPGCTGCATRGGGGGD